MRIVAGIIVDITGMLYQLGIVIGALSALLVWLYPKIKDIVHSIAELKGNVKEVSKTAADAQITATKAETKSDLTEKRVVENRSVAVQQLKATDDRIVMVANLVTPPTVPRFTDTGDKPQ